VNNLGHRRDLLCCVVRPLYTFIIALSPQKGRVNTLHTGKYPVFRKIKRGVTCREAGYSDLTAGSSEAGSSFACRQQTPGGSAMAGKTIGGISGVLGELISSTPTTTESPPHKRLSVASREPETAGIPEPPPTRPRRTRLGRPPGNASRHTGSKEKVTLRIPSDLIAEYRDWSWEARCQLSELVERALDDYRQSCRRR
jgi:hypothetical protein